MYQQVPSGNAQYGAGIANGTDIKDAIDGGSIANLTTELLGDGRLSLPEANGNAINIYNVTGDAQGNVVFGGNNSVTGLSLTTAA